MKSYTVYYISKKYTHHYIGYIYIFKNIYTATDKKLPTVILIIHIFHLRHRL